jgi:hypothetical protein
MFKLSIGRYKKRKSITEYSETELISHSAGTAVRHNFNICSNLIPDTNTENENSKKTPACTMKPVTSKWQQSQLLIC